MCHGTPRRWRQISQRKALCRYMMFRTCSGLCGRREGATESHILQGRDAHSIRVLVPDCCGLEKNFHDITVVDMGELPESEVSIPELSDLTRKWPPGDSTHEVATAGAGGNATGGKTTIPEEAAGAV